jgi:hypothetical protein
MILAWLSRSFTSTEQASHSISVSTGTPPMRQSYALDARSASLTMSRVPIAYTWLSVSESRFGFWNGTHSALKGLEDEMAAVKSCHPALAEYECVAGRLDIFWCQVLVVFTVEEDVGECTEAVLDPTRSAIVSTRSTCVAHEAASVPGCGEDLRAYNVLSSSGQGAKGAISFKDLEQ